MGICIAMFFTDSVGFSLFITVRICIGHGDLCRHVFTDSVGFSLFITVKICIGHGDFGRHVLQIHLASHY